MILYCIAFHLIALLCTVLFCLRSQQYSILIQYGRFSPHVVTWDLDCDVLIVYWESASTDYALHTDYPLSMMSAVVGGFRSLHFRCEGDSSGVLLYTRWFCCVSWPWVFILLESQRLIKSYVNSLFGRACITVPVSNSTFFTSIKVDGYLTWQACSKTEEVWVRSSRIDWLCSFIYSASISQSLSYNLYRIYKGCSLPAVSWTNYREYCKLMNLPWVGRQRNSVTPCVI